VETSRRCNKKGVRFRGSVAPAGGAWPRTPVPGG
jgi:hypothetical protein